MSRERIQAYLAENPRMIGALFALTLLAAQAGQVAANIKIANNGP